jgi:hypothetical protein
MATNNALKQKGGDSMFGRLMKIFLAKSEFECSTCGETIQSKNSDTHAKEHLDDN